MDYCTILAVITKIEGAYLQFKGVGDYLEKIDSFERNVLLFNNSPQYVKLEESFFELKDTGCLTTDSFYRELFIRSILDKKVLRLKLDHADGIYFIKSVEVP